jgi:hypothetical protein
MKARGQSTTGRDTSTAAPADTMTMPMDTTQPK